MRYISIELINYAGILNGMGLSQIKIDFTKCISNKVIIRGSNGSGKSTLMNALNPMPDPNSMFIPNMEARKNIVLFNNGVQYLIQYIHPISSNTGDRMTTKGYISKSVDGSPFNELNPSGNISSCRDILFEEFNIDANFITLSQLSSENRGLVDLKPAERKKLINSIVSVLETYNTIYKNLSKKSSVYKLNINNIISKIDYLGDQAKINAQLSNIESQLENLEKEKETTLEAIAAVKIKIQESIDILNNNQYDEVVTELSNVSRIAKATWKNIESALNKYSIESVDKLQEFITYIDKNIIILESEISALRNKIPSIMTDRENELKDIQSKEAKIQSMQSDIKGSELATSMVTFRSKIDSCESIFNAMGLKNANLITKDEFDSAMEALKTLKETATILTSSYNMDIIIEDIKNRKSQIQLIAGLQSYNDSIKSLTERKYELSSQIQLYESKRSIASNLINRPKKCTIDDCPYIVDALNAEKEYPQSALDSMQNEYSEICKQIEYYEELSSRAMESNAVRQIISSMERELNDKYKFIKKLPIRKDFKESFMERVISLDTFDDISNLYSFVDCGNLLEDYRIAKDHFSKYESEYKIFQAKEDLIDSIMNDILSLRDKVDNLSIEINSINEDILSKEKSLEDLKDSKKTIEKIYSVYSDTYRPNYDRQQELEGVKQSLDVYTTEVNQLRDNLNTLNNNYGAVNSDIKNLNEKKDALKHSLILLQDYKAELNEYQNKYTRIETIRKYSSPNSGIQSIYIGIYMNKILSTANELLALLFNGEFTLLPFVVNESEFRIPCIGNALQHDDISSMSAAQKSMISMIISFSLLKQSSTNYNIISIDEIDGALDSYNRAYFINLLDNLMRMLNCEQAFMISHNSELNTSDCDIILLKDSSNDIMRGNVIWKY